MGNRIGSGEMRIIDEQIINKLVRKLEIGLEKPGAVASTEIVEALNQHINNHKNDPHPIYVKAVAHLKVNPSKYTSVFDTEMWRRWISSSKKKYGAPIEILDYICYISYEMDWYTVLEEVLHKDESYYNATIGEYYQQKHATKKELQPDLSYFKTLQFFKDIEVHIENNITYNKRFLKENYSPQSSISSAFDDNFNHQQAVLLTGPIGCGKTFFTEYWGLSKKEAGNHVFYLSLTEEHGPIEELKNELRLLDKPTHYVIIDNCHNDPDKAHHLANVLLQLRHAKALFTTRKIDIQFTYFSAEATSYTDYFDCKIAFEPTEDDVYSVVKKFATLNQFELEAIDKKLLFSFCGGNLRVLRFFLKAWMSNGLHTSITNVSNERMLDQVRIDYIQNPINKDPNADTLTLLKIAIFYRHEFPFIVFPHHLSKNVNVFEKFGIIRRTQRITPQGIIHLYEMEHESLASYLLESVKRHPYYLHGPYKDFEITTYIDFLQDFTKHRQPDYIEYFPKFFLSIGSLKRNDIQVTLATEPSLSVWKAWEHYAELLYNKSCEPKEFFYPFAKYIVIILRISAHNKHIIHSYLRTLQIPFSQESLIRLVHMCIFRQYDALVLYNMMYHYLVVGSYMYGIGFLEGLDWHLISKRELHKSKSALTNLLSDIKKAISTQATTAQWNDLIQKVNKLMLVPQNEESTRVHTHSRFMNYLIGSLSNNWSDLRLTNLFLSVNKKVLTKIVERYLIYPENRVKSYVFISVFSKLKQNFDINLDSDLYAKALQRSERGLGIDWICLIWKLKAISSQDFLKEFNTTTILTTTTPIVINKGQNLYNIIAPLQLSQVHDVRKLFGHPQVGIDDVSTLGELSCLYLNAKFLEHTLVTHQIEDEITNYFNGNPNCNNIQKLFEEATLKDFIEFSEELMLGKLMRINVIWPENLFYSLSLTKAKKASFQELTSYYCFVRKLFPYSENNISINERIRDKVNSKTIDSKQSIENATQYLYFTLEYDGLRLEKHFLDNYIEHVEMDMTKGEQSQLQELLHCIYAICVLNSFTPPLEVLSNLNPRYVQSLANKTMQHVYLGIKGLLIAVSVSSIPSLAPKTRLQLLHYIFNAVRLLDMPFATKELILNWQKTEREIILCSRNI